MMVTLTARQQRGLTFTNFLLIAIGVMFLALLGLKVIPAYVENRTIVHILDTVAHDPEMQGALPSDIRNSYDKHAMMNNISAITSNDIVIDKTPNGSLVLS